jgi:FkbM family methyltransferase
MKLAFVLDTVFGVKDVAYDLLRIVNADTAERYRLNSGREEQTRQQAPPTTPAELRHQPLATAAQRPTSSTAATLRVNYAWQLGEPVNVVDIGANPIDGTPPYKPLLSRGMVSLVGFEPQRQALAQLNAMKGQHETYLPYAVGDGKPARLYLCQAPGMTSTLKPNTPLLAQFQGYPLWGKVKQVEVIDTVRLDDVDEVDCIDWLKIDIQGGELTVFKNAEEKLKTTLVIQTEVNFIPLYEGQPLFAEIDQWMREHGFMLHTLLEERKRLYAPMVLNGQIHQGINQLTTADAVYIPSFEKMALLGCNELKKLGMIVGEVYQSHDLALKVALLLEDKYGIPANHVINMSKTNCRMPKVNDTAGSGVVKSRGISEDIDALLK